MSAKCQKRTLRASPHRVSGGMLVIQALAAWIERAPFVAEMTSVFERLADRAREAHALAGWSVPNSGETMEARATLTANLIIPAYEPAACLLPN